MAVVRIFTCQCGHKLRYGARHCGNCWLETPVWNRRPFLYLGGTLGLCLIITLLVGLLAH